MIQITMMLLLIMILFFVCWTPLLLFNMLAAFDVIDPTLTQGDFFYICFFFTRRTFKTPGFLYKKDVANETHEATNAVQRANHCIDNIIILHFRFFSLCF